MWTRPKNTLIRKSDRLDWHLSFALALLLIFGITTAVMADDSTETRDLHLISMHTQPWFWEVLAASAVGWVIGLVKGFKTSKDWIEGYCNSPPLLVVFLLDLLIFIGVGAYFGTGIYNPESLLEAVAAGLTWPVGLGALATTD